MRVYHFTSKEYGLKAISKRRLKVARIAELNDPFDFRPVALARRIDRARLRGLLRDWNSAFGLLCYSASCANPVQWSHYADRHRGVCLGFDVPDHQLSRVEYRDALYGDIIGPAVAADDPSVIAKLMCTKYRHWEYEEEWRALCHLRDTVREGELHFVNWSEDLKLREVIVGERCELSRLALANEIGDAEVALSKARLAFQSYTVVRNQRGLR